MRRAALVCLVLGCASLGANAANAADAPKPDDQAVIQGTWLAQSESQDGLKRDVTYQYVFEGDRVTFRDENGKETTYVFQLETAASPKLMALQPVEAPANSAPVSVAYVLEGDSLTIVVAPAGSRPTEISDRNHQELILCRRLGR